MRSKLKLILCAATLSLVSSCASSNTLTGPAEGCSKLAEPVLGRVVGHATLGNSGDAAKDWQLYGLDETGRLNQSERDKRDGLAIIQMCEARDAATARRINAPWFAFWR